MSKHLRAVKKLADQWNRDVVTRKSGHLALVCRDGLRPPVFTSASPSDHRVMKNLVKHLRHSNEARDACETVG